MTILLLRTERNGTERNENGTIEKKEREQNNLAEGPHFRKERNHLKKRQNVPSPSIDFNRGSLDCQVKGTVSLISISQWYPLNLGLMKDSQCYLLNLGLMKDSQCYPLNLGLMKDVGHIYINLLNALNC